MPAAPDLLKPTDAAAVAELTGKVRVALGSDLLEMRLFGSKATGHDSPDSDIDILVVVAEARPDVEDQIPAIAFDVNLGSRRLHLPERRRPGNPGGSGLADHAVPQSCPRRSSGVKEELKALARHRLARAREAFADQLLATGAARGATNRFYAAFFAARALLATREVDSSKHSGVVPLFQRHFVKAGHFDVETARTLARVFEKRQKTDYADFATITAEEVRLVRAEVEAFVEECARVFDHATTADD